MTMWSPPPPLRMHPGTSPLLFDLFIFNHFIEKNAIHPNKKVWLSPTPPPYLTESWAESQIQWEHIGVISYRGYRIPLPSPAVKNVGAPPHIFIHGRNDLHGRRWWDGSGSSKLKILPPTASWRTPSHSHNSVQCCIRNWMTESRPSYTPAAGETWVDQHPNSYFYIYKLKKNSARFVKQWDLFNLIYFTHVPTGFHYKRAPFTRSPLFGALLELPEFRVVAFPLMVKSNWPSYVCSIFGSH